MSFWWSEFVCSAPICGFIPAAFNTCDPIPLRNGISVDRVFEVCLSQWLSLRQQVHRGGAIVANLEAWQARAPVARLGGTHWDGDAVNGSIQDALEGTLITACA